MNKKICKRCGGKIIAEKRKVFCSYECGHRHSKSVWQKKYRKEINKVRNLWRLKTKRKSDNKWNEKNPHKIKAHNFIKTAIRSGTIKKLPCSICGNLKSKAHHPDYSKPFEVIWFCEQHHNDEHRRLLADKNKDVVKL